jgi:adenine phosphoribosyltransferase
MLVFAMTGRERHRVQIEGVARDLPPFEVAPGLRIPILNLLGDTEVVEAAARGLAQRLEGVDHDVLVTAETKSVPLVYALARELHMPWVVLRKHYKPYMGKTITARTRSITTDHEQTLHLDEKDVSLVAGRRAVIVDDVISTGSTLDAIRSVIIAAGGDVVGVAAVFTEGDGHHPTDGVVSLGHLPVFHGIAR